MSKRKPNKDIGSNPFNEWRESEDVSGDSNELSECKVISMKTENELIAQIIQDMIDNIDCSTYQVIVDQTSLDTLIKAMEMKLKISDKSVEKSEQKFVEIETNYKTIRKEYKEAKEERDRDTRTLNLLKAHLENKCTNI